MVHSIKGGGKGGNMPDIIQVKVSQDEDIYCKDDPHHMQHSREKMVEWHSNRIEFEIEFLNESPFVTGETVLRSENKKTQALEVEHPGKNGMNAYVYEVREQNSSGKQLKADPGLIVEP